MENTVFDLKGTQIEKIKQVKDKLDENPIVIYLCQTI